MADDKSRGLSVKVDVDVSDALKGLKALQREAKAATRAINELDTVMGDTSGLSKYTTKQLHEELCRREGVHELIVCLEEDVAMSIFSKQNLYDPKYYTTTGPARILINKD